MKLKIRTKIKRETARKMVSRIIDTFKDGSVTLEGLLLLHYTDGDFLGFNYLRYDFERVCEVSQYKSNGNYHRIRIDSETGDVILTHCSERGESPEKLTNMIGSKELDTLQKSEWKLVLYTKKFFDVSQKQIHPSCCSEDSLHMSQV